MRALTVSSILLALASAFLLYGLNYDTRRLAAKVHTQERAADAARGDIALLKAERAHLSRPERIEPAARAIGLAPATESQFVAGADDALDPAKPTGRTPAAR